MEFFVRGNIAFRVMLFEQPGEQSISHSHNFDHVHYVRHGGRRVEKLKPTKFDADGQPVDFEVVMSKEIWATDRYPFLTIEAGVWHRTIALEPRVDITSAQIEAAKAAAPDVPEDAIRAIYTAMAGLDKRSYGDCVYAHRTPQALVDRQGQDPEYDALLEKLIAMSNEKFGTLIQVYDGWQGAYN